MKLIRPKEGNYIQLNSCDWIIFKNGYWRLMTVNEQLKVSK